MEKLFQNRKAHSQSTAGCDQREQFLGELHKFLYNSKLEPIAKSLEKDKQSAAYEDMQVDVYEKVPECDKTDGLFFL